MNLIGDGMENWRSSRFTDQDNGCSAWLWTQLVDHPLYSPDLAPSITIFCSPIWRRKKELCSRTQYRTDHDVMTICSWGLFRGSGWDLGFYTTMSRITKRCNTNGRSVWTGRGDCVEILTTFGQIRLLHNDKADELFNLPSYVNV